MALNRLRHNNNTGPRWSVDVGVVDEVGVPTRFAAEPVARGDGGGTDHLLIGQRIAWLIALLRHLRFHCKCIVVDIIVIVVVIVVVANRCLNDSWLSKVIRINL